MTDQPYANDFTITLPEPYLTAIGKVCVAWGTLESVVDLALSKFAGYREPLDLRSAIVTAHMPWPLKMDVLAAFVDALRGPEYPWLEQFDSVKVLLAAAQKGRNRIVHGQWGYQNGRVQKARATARGKLRASIDTITIADIDAIVRDIGRAGAALLKLVVNR